MISAPNGPVVIFLIGAMTAVATSGVGAADLPMALAVLVMLAGAAQILLGLTGGGQLVKYIPYPVVSGLVTARRPVDDRFAVAQPVGRFPEGVSNAVELARVMAITALGLGSAGRTIGFGDAAMLLVPVGTDPRHPVRNLLDAAPDDEGSRHRRGASWPDSRSSTSPRCSFPAPFPRAWIVGTIPGPDSLALNVTLPALAHLPWSTMIVSGMALAVGRLHRLPGNRRGRRFGHRQSP